MTKSIPFDINETNDDDIFVERSTMSAEEVLWLFDEPELTTSSSNSVQPLDPDDHADALFRQRVSNAAAAASTTLDYGILPFLDLLSPSISTGSDTLAIPPPLPSSLFSAQIGAERDPQTDLGEAILQLIYPPAVHDHYDDIEDAAFSDWKGDDQ